MQNIPPNVQHELQQFQQLEQQYQMIVTQKQKISVDLREVELALTELDKKPEIVYKSIGSVLVKSNPDEVLKELEEKKETLSARLESLERQEKRLLEKLKEKQAQIQKMLSASG